MFGAQGAVKKVRQPIQLLSPARLLVLAEFAPQSGLACVFAFAPGLESGFECPNAVTRRSRAGGLWKRGGVTSRLAIEPHTEC